ncbi:hypothetical protein FHY52_12890 [Nocardia nova]|nr:hypothetical protein [Nocardia nova]
MGPRGRRGVGIGGRFAGGRFRGRRGSLRRRGGGRHGRCERGVARLGLGRGAGRRGGGGAPGRGIRRDTPGGRGRNDHRGGGGGAAARDRGGGHLQIRGERRRGDIDVLVADSAGSDQHQTQRYRTGGHCGTRDLHVQAARGLLIGAIPRARPVVHGCGAPSNCFRVDSQ